MDDQRKNVTHLSSKTIASFSVPFKMMAMNGSGSERRSEEPILLYGTFYPQFDIPVIILWTFIIIAGLGNWAWIYCFLTTKALRIPFNTVVLALTVANSISTTIICPMQLRRVIILYHPVPALWCKVRIALRTFCFTVSLVIIFTIAVLRLYAGVSRTQLKLTFKKIGTTLAVIYGLGALSSVLVLDEGSSFFATCMTGPDTNVAYASSDMNAVPATGSDYENDTVYTTTTRITNLENPDSTIPTVVNEITTTVEDKYDAFVESVNENSTGSIPTSNVIWYGYFFVSAGLFLATVTCYISLTIILRKHHDAIKDVTLSNKKNILTLQVTAYVTASVFTSFLVPFFPVFVVLPPQNSAGSKHYIALFECLSSLDGAITPIIYYFSNKVYNAAFHRTMAQLARGITVLCSPKVTPVGNPPDPSHVDLDAPVILHLKPEPYVPRVQLVAPV